MKKFILFSLITFNTLSAQVIPTWVSTFNGPSDKSDEPRSMVIDATGNIYVAGLVSTISFIGASDFATIKYNSSGVQLWAAYYNGPAPADSSRDLATSIAVDNAGNVYVTGSSYGGATNYDYVTIKYNSNGVQQWAMRYNSINNNSDNAIGIAVDNQKNVYVTGSSPGDGTLTEFTTIKYDSMGVQKWLRGYLGVGDLSGQPNAIKLDNAGNIYVTGSTNRLGSGNNYATVKYNSTGSELWAVQYFGLSSFQDDAYSLALDNSGNVYVTGSSWGPTSNLDYATIKYNSSGVQQWARRYNGSGNSTDIANTVLTDSIGNVYITGFSLGAGTSYDFATLKYNSNGDSLWVKRYDYGPGGNRDDRAFDLTLDNAGNIYVTGWSASSTFDDYATIKYNSLGVQQWIQRTNGVSNNNDDAVAVVVDNSSNVYVTGKSWNASSGNDFLTIKFSIAKSLQLTALIEGFYNQTSGTMISDTMTVYLRNVTPPYAVIDSAKGFINSAGTGVFNFSQPVNEVPYFIVVRHRNSIETWSSGGNSFTSNSLTYNFTASAFQAFGNNQVLKGTKYCIYSGDVNQNGNVSLSDIILTSNNSVNFVNGYVSTDLNGDNNTNLNDILIAFNNSNGFVSVMRP